MDQGLVMDRQNMDVDIVCVGFGPATGGFLTTLSRAIAGSESEAPLMSRVMPGMPLQVLCYERADDIGFGVSGVVTRGRGIKKSFPELDVSQIQMATPVAKEKLLYLLDPHGASRRPAALEGIDAMIRAVRSGSQTQDSSIEVPYVPDFLAKHDGFLLSIGQFNQWVGTELMGSGLVQVWPGMPVSAPLIEDDRVVGIRLVDQGTESDGTPGPGFMPGMDVRAALTVVGDGPVGPIGRQLDEHFGFPEGHHQNDWAVGMKMVVDLPTHCPLAPGTVLHTIGYPEPEIFGFLYVHPGHVASLGIFVPTWFDSPVRTSYAYLQHWMKHPRIWKYLEGGSLRSWGAKTLQESGRRGEPHLVGDGYARIGEGSGSTNVLTGSGVDEAWTTGVLLAEGVIELWRAEQPFTRQNLDAAYVTRRRNSWLEAEAKESEKSRDGFQKGFLTGLLGMGLTGLTHGKLHVGPDPVPPRDRIPTLEEYYEGRIPPSQIEAIRQECKSKGEPLHTALMEAAGWPEVEYDGELLMSHQDALLRGGKVQAPPGYADHVVFVYPSLCESCVNQLCIEVCSGQAITPGESGVPQFDREKCIHCGACIWSCAVPREPGAHAGNIEFRAGAGGLHSGEN